MDDVAQFLPKYPNIFPASQKILNMYEGDFNREIFLKKEFHDLTLPETETPPSQDSVGVLQRHQKIIARFLSSHTLYDGLLLLHAPGTGKTCAAVGAIEQIRAEGGGFRKAIVCVKGPDLVNAFKAEIVYRCTSGQYIPPDPDNDITVGEREARTNKLLGEFYEFKRMQTFAKNLRGMPDATIRDEYSNCVIVIDEVHNLRDKDASGKAPYDMFWRLLHVAQGCKVLLMSGTPMKDGVDEISSIMNLILPADPKQQLPAGEKFLSKFFNSADSGVFNRNGDPLPIRTVKPSMVARLKRAFKGRVSYLRLATSDVPKEFEGREVIDAPELELKHLKVVLDRMSDHQTNGYNAALAEESADKKKKNFFIGARQASLFVFPDGSYGDVGFKKYMSLDGKIGMSRGMMKLKGKKQTTNKHYGPSAELLAAIKENGTSHEAMLSKIRVYSSKYADTISQLLRARDEGKSSFVYASFVKGSGIILFAALLKLFGFKSANGSETTEAPRFALITGITATQGELKAVKALFNSDANKHGQIISVVLGSPKVSEGFTFKNVQSETMLTPFWNYSGTTQVLARGYRLGSHLALENEEGYAPRMDIYQRVSVPNTPDGFSIDLYMYQVSEVKDVSIKGVERLMKEAAFDCALTYNRNRVRGAGMDNTALCDYMGCEYSCDGIDPELLLEGGVTPGMLDYSTYELYYSADRVEQITNIVVAMFQKQFRTSLSAIRAEVSVTFPDATDFEVLTALRSIIHQNEIIPNQYGLPSYLREQDDVYYLVGSLSVMATVSAEYYTSNPNLSAGNTFSGILTEMESRSLREVKRACDSRTAEEVAKNTSVLPLRVQEAIIEAAITSKIRKMKVNTVFRDLVLKCYDGAYEQVGENSWLSHMLYETEGVLRCLTGKGKWHNCDKDEMSKFLKRRAAWTKKLESNEYKHYGIAALKDGKRVFKIRDVRDLAGKATKRDKPSGRDCESWPVPTLTNLIVNVLKIPAPSSYMPQASKKQLFDSIDTKKLTKTMPFKSMSMDDARRASYWTVGPLQARQKTPMCRTILEWFEKKKLLHSQPGCIGP